MRQLTGWAIIVSSTAGFIFGFNLFGSAGCLGGCQSARGATGAAIIIASVAWFFIGFAVKNGKE